MAYEYNSQDQRFEFPNPYKIENIFKFAGAAIFIISGLWLLLSAKQALSSNLMLAISPLIIGIMMLSYGGLLLAKGFSHLKFYFGRNQPVGLGQEFSANNTGSSPMAQQLKDTLRQSALTYHEPSGSVNGILYSLFPNLIFSPLFIRHAAEVQFQNAIVFSITLISALVAYVGASSNTADWLGIFYCLLCILVLLRPMANQNLDSADIGISKVVALVVIAILGPVVIPLFTKNAFAPAWLPSMGQAIFILITALIAIGLFFLAVLAQIVKTPPQASAGMVQDSMSLNCQPMQLFDELERHLQNQWVSSMPNRIYSRILPILENNKVRGSFEGELLEETQPVPANTLKDMTLASCFKEAHYRWLGILNSFGLLCFLIAVIALISFAADFYTGQYLNKSVFSFVFLGFSMWILGKFCFDHGNYLWSRFDFVSQLIWVEAKGNYQSSRLDFGRYLEDTVKTQREVINIETMTLRVWYAEISSTTFGKNQQRSILSMVARKDDAIQLKDHLHIFAQEQSMILAPTATADIQRISTLNQINAANQAKSSELAAQLKIAEQPLEEFAISSADSNQSPAVLPQTDTSFCISCGNKLLSTMLFCPQCGTKKDNLTT